MEEREKKGVSERYLDSIGFASSIHIYSSINGSFIKELEQQGLIEKQGEKLLLTEYGLAILNLLVNRFKIISFFDVFCFIDKKFDEFIENISAQSKEIEKNYEEIRIKLNKIGNQMNQNFPELLTHLETDLLCAIHRAGKFTEEEIRMFPRGRCHRNYLYSVLKKMSDKGFIKDKGSGKKHYVLTNHGKNQVLWHLSKMETIPI